MDGADVVSGFEEVGGEGVSEGVRGDAFVYLAEAGGFFDGFLQSAFVEVMALDGSGSRVTGAFAGGEEVLPNPFSVGIEVFSVKGVGEVYGSETFVEVFLVEGFGLGKLNAQGFNKQVGKEGEAVASAFSIPYNDLAVGEVDVFDAQSAYFH